jgi:hypothetical protein
MSVVGSANAAVGVARTVKIKKLWWEILLLGIMWEECGVRLDDAKYKSRYNGPAFDTHVRSPFVILSTKISLQVGGAVVHPSTTQRATCNPLHELTG